MNETMWRLQTLLLAKPKPAGRKLAGWPLAIIALILLLAGGSAFAQEPDEKEKRAAHQQCLKELGPTGVPTWTSEWVMVCRRITLAQQ